MHLDGVARAGRPSRLSFTVREAGLPSDLQHLGHIHVTALRLGDLTPAQISLEIEPDSESVVHIDLACSRAGTYRLFLTFESQAAAQTAEFTLPVSA